MPDSERVITTAARALYEVDPFVTEHNHLIPWDELRTPSHRLYEGQAEAVVDAVRPLIVGEEHDRLRNHLETRASMYQTPDGDPGPMGDVWGWRDVAKWLRYEAALLGESTQEPKEGISE